MPKNARLMQAIAQHKTAKPKPKGWLLGVVEAIFKDGETLTRKFSRSGAGRSAALLAYDLLGLADACHYL